MPYPPPRILLVLTLVLGLAASACSNELPLQVTALQPEANYPQTKDPGDAVQLTDGKTHMFPFWTQPGSVGWQQRTPVRISLQAAMKAGVNYQLGIRTANRDRAGVHPPRRIDVYCGGSGSHRHIAQLNTQAEQFERDGVVDLELLLPGCKGGALDIILHAQGQYLMLDEITLTPARGAALAAIDAGEIIVDVMEDSRARLEKSLLEQAPPTPKPVSRRSTWLAAPWGDLYGRESGDHLDVLTLPSAGATYVLGIHNAANKTRRYTLTLDPRIAKQTRISRLRAVLSANGDKVLDAIEPEAERAWDISAGESLYLMVQEPRDAAGGERIHRIAGAEGEETTLRVNVVLLDRIRPESEDRPYVNTWAYPTDRPIWTPDNATQIMAELVEAGVNVHVAPTRHIPMPFPPANQENEKRMRALAEDIRLYKGNGLILLFTGESLWNQIKEQLHGPEAQQALGQWAVNLSQFMAEQGVAPEQWALYLVDEPRNEDLELLARVIPLLRKSAPQLHFYANPIPGRAAQSIKDKTIRDLAGLVDHWQPRAGKAYEAVREALPASNRGRIWLYDNPCPPAKAATPSWYRNLARRAFDANALGFGFWSFSATNNSSAWDDLDGHRADWAVVYEAKDGFVSSRRWAAFKQGVQEYAGLRYCARQSGTNAKLTAQCQLLRESTPAQEMRCKD
jgi:hypothetical protein